MMCEIVKLLILDDEDGVRKALQRAFCENTRQYKFEIEVAKSPEECIRKGLDRERFDVYLVDLELEAGVQPHFGQSFIAVRAIQVEGSLTVVYSCHSQVESITGAIRCGAAAFLSKSDFAPHQVPEHVVNLLDEQREARQREARIAQLREEKLPQWQNQYPGQVLAIVDGQPVLNQGTKLGALVLYNSMRANHPAWPAFPDLVEIPDR